MKFPLDPTMLMSMINTKLRDGEESLDELCKTIGMDKDDLIEKLKEAGFKYVPDLKQFK